jgi:broad specificity phosphatase PhoE
MKTTLIAVRHGQSQANLENKFAGTTDAPLSALGHVQAQKTAEYLAATPIDVILSSPLSRAYATAEPIAKSHGLPITVVDDLHEIYGGKWEGMYWPDIITQYKDQFKLWESDFSRVVCPDGDSMVDAFARAKRVLSDICERYEGKTVCFATHAGLMRSMRAVWLGGDVKMLAEIAWASNASVSRVQYENGIYRPLSYSEDAHLAELKTTFDAVK